MLMTRPDSVSTAVGAAEPSVRTVATGMADTVTGSVAADIPVFTMWNTSSPALRVCRELLNRSGSAWAVPNSGGASGELAAPLSQRPRR